VNVSEGNKKLLWNAVKRAVAVLVSGLDVFFGTDKTPHDK